MNKELTPLEALKELYHEREYTYAESVNHKSKKWANDIKHYDNIGDCLYIIETALKEHEEYKKLLNEQAKSNRYLMKQIKQSQEKLKALEIIEEKRVDVCYFMNCRTLEEYNDDVLASYAYEEDDAEQRMLTQEEYDILKRSIK